MKTVNRSSFVFSLALLSGTVTLAGEDTMPNVAEGNNRFALDLYGTLREQPGNLFFAPESISTALAMTFAGARGETADQMARTLYFPKEPEVVQQGFEKLAELIRPRGEKPGYRLNEANRLWGQLGYHFLPDFLDVTRKSYHAELAPVDFANDTENARDQINQWVEKQTEERIKDLVPPGVLTNLTRLVLTNAIYFKGDWTKPFDKSMTREQDFHISADKSARVPMMHKVDRYRLVAEDGYKVLELPYGNGDVSTFILLPDAIDGLSGLESKLKPEMISAWQRAATAKVDLFLPRFKLTSQFSLKSSLSGLGMKLPFDPDRADFSGISSQERMHISEVLHKAFVDVNEEGTEAAAATAVVIGVRAIREPEQIQVFRADHPFLFLIVNKPSQSILFLGRVVEPAG